MEPETEALFAEELLNGITTDELESGDEHEYGGQHPLDYIYDLAVKMGAGHSPVPIEHLLTKAPRSLPLISDWIELGVFLINSDRTHIHMDMS